MSQTWLPLVASEVDSEPIEVETEEDGRLLLEHVQQQFPGAKGLRFRNKETGALRGVRMQNDILCPPFDSGWGSGPYIVITNNTLPSPNCPTKRKAADSLSDGDEGGSSASSCASGSTIYNAKNPRLEAASTTTNDLIVLNLAFTTSEQEVRDFFAAFGPLKMCQLKRKESGRSKGYAFIHYESLDVQRKVLMQRHQVGERWCDVKVPNSQDKSGFKETDSAREYKICVRRLEDSISKEDLTEHFESFGRITDIFYPKPSRGFAFITFVEKNVAKSLIGLEHTINGITVSIMEPSSKPKYDPNGAPVTQQQGRDQPNPINGQWSWPQQQQQLPPPPQQQGGYGYPGGRAPWAGGSNGGQNWN